VHVSDTVVVQCRPVGAEVTVYLVIALPPDAGAVQETLALASPAVAVGGEGLDGTVDGVTSGEGVEAGPVPLAFVATTVKV
jgi:hypothetical protein